MVDGLPVTKPERVVFELAGIWPSVRFLEILVQAGRRRRLLTYESTREMFERHARRGLRGVASLRQVLDAWDPTNRPTESDMETRLLQLLLADGYERPVPQLVITTPTGDFVARVDVGLPHRRVAIDYDSKQEHSDEFQLTRDARRRNRIVAAGWRYLSARHADIESGGAELLAAIDAMGEPN